MKSHRRDASWTVAVPGPKTSGKLKKVKKVASVILTATAISVAYFGVIALLMAPAFDVIPRA